MAKIKILLSIKKLNALLVVLVLTAGIFNSSTAAQGINVLRDYYIESFQNYSLFIAKLDKTPDYEILSFPENKIISIKFRNTTLPRSITNQQKFGNEIIDFVNAEKIAPKEVWLKITIKADDIAYLVDEASLKEGFLVMRLYKGPLQKTYDPKHPDALKNTLLVKDLENEKIAFIFNKTPEFEIASNSIPKVKINITFKQTKLEFNPPKIESEFIESLKYQPKEDDLLVEITLFSPNVSIKSEVLRRPYQLLLTIDKSAAGLAISDDERIDFLQNPNLPEEGNPSLAKFQFIEAEEEFRKLNYKEAYRKFNEVYSMAPTGELGMMALFRAADSLHYLQQQQKKFDGYQKVIKAYDRAINLAARLSIDDYDMANSLLKTGLNYQYDRLYEEAADYYHQLIRQSPDSHYVKEAKFRLAEVSLLQKNYNEATRLFQDYLKNFKTSLFTAQANTNLAIALYNLNRYEDAYKHFLTGRALNPEFSDSAPEILYPELDTYYNQKAYQSFIATSKKLIDKFPQSLLSTVAAIDLGDYYVSEAQEEEAVLYYDFAEKNGDKNISDLAKIRSANIDAENFLTEKYQNAISEYDEIYQNSDNDSIKQEALMRKILAHSFQEQGELAIQGIEDYQKIYPEGLYATNGALKTLLIENITSLVAKAYLNDRYNDVISQYVRHRRIINESGDNFLLWLLASSYYKLNNFQDANQFYQLLLNAQSTSREGELKFEIGDNLILSGEHEEALVYFKEVIQTTPDTVFGNYAKYRIADIYIDQKEYEKALTTLRDLIEQNIDNNDPLYYDLIPEAWFKIGEINKELGFYEKAFQNYETVKNSFRHALTDPNVPEYVSLSFFYAADMIRILGAQSRALSLYQNAIDNYPDSAQKSWALYHSANIYLQQEKYQEALDRFEMIISAQSPTSNYLLNLANNAKQEIEDNRNYARYLLGDVGG